MILIFYIIPATLSILLMYINLREVTRGDLVKIILISMLPVVNLLIGYIGGLVFLSELKQVKNFLNKRIK